jgi:ATP-dependent Zn protease
LDFYHEKMSGGGGGGSGQIFTLENQKQNFDEKTDVKTTFKDVAGLEGAKEIQEIVDSKTQRNTQTLVVKFQGALLVWSS